MGEVKLPLTVIFPDKNRQNFQLNLFVEKKEVKITNQDNVTRSPAFRKKFGFWFGAGFNYVRMKQTSDDIGSDLLFESFKTPSLYAKIKGNISSRWDLVYTFKLSPGEATSGVTTVNQGTYNWLTNTLEARWSPTSWQTKIFNNKGQWALRFGAQHHTLPYIDRVSAGVADIVENSVTMASLGGQYVEVLNRNWDFEFFMRYQHPLSNGDNFDVESSFAFDGSLGLIRSFSEGWKAGIFWYGQLQNYSISAHDSVANLDIEGENSYFYSNVDLRLGYTF